MSQISTESVTDSILSEYTEVQDEKLNEDIIMNFVYIYLTTQKKSRSIEDMEKKVVRIAKKMHNIDYLHMYHLDLFVENEKEIGNIAELSCVYQFNLSDYLRYKTVYAEVKTYFEGLQKGSNFYEEKRRKGIFTLKWRYPEGSIFRTLDAEEFGRGVHKMFVYYYYLSEMRYFQYVAKFENKVVSGYCGAFKTFYNNFIRKMEGELQLYIQEKRYDVFLDILEKTCMTLLNLGNVNLAQVLVNLCCRLKEYRPTKVETFVKHIGNLADFKKYTYLVDPDMLQRAFVMAYESRKKTVSFGYIYRKVLQTKGELLKDTCFSMYIDMKDETLYHYIQPNVYIKGDFL